MDGSNKKLWKAQKTPACMDAPDEVQWVKRGSCDACRYKLTGETGSYRYMAPEVFRHEPYNTKVGCPTLRSSACLPCHEQVPTHLCIIHLERLCSSSHCGMRLATPHIAARGLHRLPERSFGPHSNSPRTLAALRFAAHWLKTVRAPCMDRWTCMPSP